MADELTNEPTSNQAEPQAAEPSNAKPQQQASSPPADKPQGRGRTSRGGGGRGGASQGRPGRRPGGRGGRSEAAAEREPGALDETVVKIYRCAKVVKGGRRFSFGALVVVGDRISRVGVGYGKANEVPSAVEKARKAAQRAMVDIKLDGTTLPHPVKAKYRASQVLLLPARKGTGVIAGASVRAVMELAGVKDVYTKVHGSTGPKNLVKAAFTGLLSLRKRDEVSKLRGVSLA